jgi:hypothetical protein
MEALVNAASEFLAAIFARFGFVGRPRRRAAIRDELDLLAQIRESPDFGTSSKAHKFFSDHITSEIARYSGVELKRKRKIPWSSVVLALFIGLPLAYWTFKLNQDHFSWFSLLPGLLAALMLLAVLGMLFGDSSSSEEESGSSREAEATL